MYNSYIAIYFGTLIGLLWLYYTNDRAQYLLRQEVEYFHSGISDTGCLFVIYLVFMFWPIALLSKIIKG